MHKEPRICHWRLYDPAGSRTGLAPCCWAFTTTASFVTPDGWNRIHQPNAEGLEIPVERNRAQELAAQRTAHRSERQGSPLGKAATGGGSCLYRLDRRRTIAPSLFQGLREDKRKSDPARKCSACGKRSSYRSSSVAPVADSKAESDPIAGVKLSHPDKVLYPEQGITKHELAEYYEKISDWILPHVRGRPLTLVRCPKSQQQCFYQRNAEDGIPAEIRRLPFAKANR